MTDILAMRPQQFKYYLQAKEIIIARERLNMMDAVKYATLSFKDQQKKHKEVYKKAYPDKFEQRIVKTSDLELI